MLYQDVSAFTIQTFMDNANIDSVLYFILFFTFEIQLCNRSHTNQFILINKAVD